MTRPEAKPWHRVAMGGALVALGSVIVGARRGRAADPTPPAAREPRSRRRQMEASDVTLKPRPPEPSRDTQYWPPPAPPPIEGTPPSDDTEGGTLPVDAESARRGYEVADTRAGYLARVMAFSVAVIVCSVAGLFYMVGHYHRADSRAGPLTPQQSAVIVPPGPRLQAHPLHDIAMERQRETDLLRFYAWADPGHRTARIPIDRAEALVIGRPLDPLPGSDASPEPSRATGSPGPGAPRPARPQP